MCGIIGYVGKGNVTEIILSGLQKLEYRGYDSAGFALLPRSDAGLTCVKSVGKISALREATGLCMQTMKADEFELGIGHTRWATHGEPSERNAHPHLSGNAAFAVVHNGIIENYARLKEKLINDGCVFKSETDSEVLAHLIEKSFSGDLHEAVLSALESVEGTYGMAVISTLDRGKIVAARKGSPIVIGVGAEESIVASDLSAIVAHTQNVVFLDDGDVATVTADNVRISSLRNVPVHRNVTSVDWDPGRAEKGKYKHYMLKEIHEQPDALRNAIRGRLVEKDGTVKLSGLQMAPAEIGRIDRIIIAACGTSYYAGMVGKRLFEDLADIPVDVEQAAEFRYSNPIIQKDTCMFAVSQSGETADTIEAVREGMRKGASVFGICNVVGSTIARETGRGIYLHAGPEMGVASTKAFTCQVAALAMTAIMFGRSRRMSAGLGRELTTALAGLPEIAAGVLAQDDKIKAIAEKYAHVNHFFYLGRGYMFPAALEGALKLKEISYIHAEGYHAAELKHGPIALLDETIPVLAAVPDTRDKHKTINNMQECLARKSPVIAVATEGDSDVDSYCTDVLRIPPCPEFILPVPVVIAEQLFAYHVAECRGCPIDQPRNLAKSVTVE